MNYQHKELAEGRWFNLSLIQQLANVGSEVERAISWRHRNRQYSRKALQRALELLEFTLSDEKNRSFSRLKEISRIKEILIDYFYADNQFCSSDEFFHRYFHAFAYASRLRKTS